MKSFIINRIILLKVNCILGPNSDASNVAGWTNYPIVPVTVSSKKSNIDTF